MNNAQTTTPTPTESEIQRIADAFVQRHVHANCSAMMADLAVEAPGLEAYDDILSLHEGPTDPPEVEPDQYILVMDLHERGEVSATVYGPVTDASVDDVESAHPEADVDDLPEVWSFRGTGEEGSNLDGSETLDITDADQLCGYLVNVGELPKSATLHDDGDAIEVEEFDPCEVFEHWIISGWLADKLEEQGEAVAQPWGDVHIWGRTCTGQAISLDHNIRTLALEYPHA